MTTPVRHPAAPVIGLLGGVASGKSLVASELARLGAVTLDADKVGHAVLEEPEVKRKLQARWGDGVLTPSGQVDRAAVGRIVFGDPPRGPEELRFLEGIVHPRISQRLREEIAAARASGVPAIVLDAAVMLKAGWDRECDTIWFVDVPQAVRAARARQRGWNEEQFAAREAAQETVEEKRRHCDAVIDNSGTPEQTAQRIRVLWEQFTGQ